MVTEEEAGIKIVEEVEIVADFRTTTMVVDDSVKEISTMEVIFLISLRISQILNLGL